MVRKPAEPASEFEREAYAFARQWAKGVNRRDLIKAFGLGATAALLNPLVTAAGPGIQSKGALPRIQSSDSLKIARGQVTDSLDPQKTGLLVAHEILWQIFDSLIYLDEAGEVHPGLATSWEFSSDNLSITFKLREHVSFHDGTPLDSTIVKATTERHLDPATASPTAYLLGPLESVTEIDPLTVAYNYSEPFAPLFVGLGYSYCAPISIPAAEESGDQFGRNPVGTGPYKFVSWSADDTITLEKNEDHDWSTTFYTNQQPPQIDTVDFMVIPDDATRIEALSSGQIDIIAGTDAIPVDKITSLGTQDGIAVYTRPAVGVYYASLNQLVEPLDDVRVRRAINHAVDREKLVQLVLDGNGTPATSLLASSFGDYNPDARQYPYDPDLARSLLAEAGLEDGFETTYLNIASPVYQRAAESIQEDLSQINITLNIESYPVAQLVPMGQSGEYGMSFFYYTFSDPDILYSVMRTGEAFAWCNHNDDELDGLLEQQRTEFDPDTRRDVLLSTQDKINEDALTLLLWEGVYAAAMQDFVQGLEIDLVGFIHLQELSLQGS